MFKSIETKKYLQYDSTKHEYYSVYKVVDDDFEEEIEYISSRESPAPRRIVETELVISLYLKRSLNVPKNLFFLFKYNEKLRGAVEDQIEYCMKYVKGIDKYKDSIEKYLILL